MSIIEVSCKSLVHDIGGLPHKVPMDGYLKCSSGWLYKMCQWLAIENVPMAFQKRTSQLMSNDSFSGACCTGMKILQGGHHWAEK